MKGEEGKEAVDRLYIHGEHGQSKSFTKRVHYMEYGWC